VRTSKEDLRRIYAESKTIAVVGASDKPDRPGHTIPRYLQCQGYRIVPVRPRGEEILGERVYPSLEVIDVPIDVVDVFRRPQEAADIARRAAAIGARVVWFQPGTESEEGIRAGREAGLTVVAGLCMGETHRKLGLGPGP
jgi:predicted CoA-binding protein